MTDTSLVGPLSRCGTCGQTDDHPKHQILVGFNNAHTGGQMFHAHDFNREGMIYYHFDCPTPWHYEVSDPKHLRICALAASGVRGAELRARIEGGDI